MPTQPSKSLETFANPAPQRDYEISFECPEFTCLCPLTGQPDFATIKIRYVPDQRCVELKSLKLYLWSYRNEGAFHEAVTNRILDDLVAAAAPRGGSFHGARRNHHRGYRVARQGPPFLAATLMGRIAFFESVVGSSLCIALDVLCPDPDVVESLRGALVSNSGGPLIEKCVERGAYRSQAQHRD